MDNYPLDSTVVFCLHNINVRRFPRILSLLNKLSQTMSRKEFRGCLDSIFWGSPQLAMLWVIQHSPACSSLISCLMQGSNWVNPSTVGSIKSKFITGNCLKSVRSSPLTKPSKYSVNTRLVLVRGWANSCRVENQRSKSFSLARVKALSFLEKKFLKKSKAMPTPYFWTSQLK